MWAHLEKIEESLKDLRGAPTAEKEKPVFHEGQPLQKSKEQAKCPEFASSKCVIIHQQDYSLTRLIYPNFIDNPSTKKDIQHVKQIAKGFGIHDKDVIDCENMTINQLNTLFNRIKKEFRAFSKEDKKCFLFVYCIGLGVSDLDHYMLLNTTEGNVYSIEQTCKDVLTVTNNKSIVFSVYDLNTSLLS